MALTPHQRLLAKKAIQKSLFPSIAKKAPARKRLTLHKKPSSLQEHLRPQLRPFTGTQIVRRYSLYVGEHIPQYVGFIKRGHREILLNKRQGLFSHALAQLEAIEKKAFAEGRFDEYRQDISQELKLDSPKAKEAIAFLATLTKPTYIDYTKRIDSACALLKNGYRLAPFSKQDLALHGVSVEGTSRQLIMSLQQQHRLNYRVFLLFTKPASK